MRQEEKKLKDEEDRKELEAKIIKKSSCNKKETNEKTDCFRRNFR